MGVELQPARGRTNEPPVAFLRLDHDGAIAGATSPGDWVKLLRPGRPIALRMAGKNKQTKAANFDAQLGAMVAAREAALLCGIGRTTWYTYTGGSWRKGT